MTTGFQAVDRVLVRVSGRDAEGFLQDMVTNDVRREGLIYAALLTPQGKFLADFFVLREGDGFLLDIDRETAPSLVQRLNMYRLRADVTIAPADGAIWVVDQGGNPDPRAAGLGGRLYGNRPDMAAMKPEDWEAKRIAAVVPKAGAELIANDSYILECGFERLKGVDFRKGCYVGQEVTARMKHKTELRKGIAGVAFGGDVAPGAEITCDGRITGHVTSVAGPIGIAYLRFDRVGGGMQADGVEVTLRDPD